MGRVGFWRGRFQNYKGQKGKGGVLSQSPDLAKQNLKCYIK